jgi:pyruvate dehydrogenase complex dehydrogenase (E1) component
MAEDRRDVGLLAITSADRLNAGWTAAQRARERGLVHARSHIERLLADVPTNCGIVTVLDGHPASIKSQHPRCVAPIVSGCENPRKDGGELDRWAENRRCSGWVRVI